jgi:predicted glutamine amidotransferase
MCRLLGWASPEPLTATEVVGEDAGRLHALSRLHQDGWGEAWFEQGEVRRRREVDAAHASSLFATTIEQVRTPVGLVHLRWATGDLARRLPNTHPFVRDGVAFAHNGALRRGPQLDVLIDDDLLAGAEGDTDSERWFLAILTARRRGGTLAGAVAEVLGTLDPDSWNSLNFVLLEPGRLHALCCNDAARRPRTSAPDYFRMFFETTSGCTSVWSSGVRTPTAGELPNRHLMSVDVAGEVHVTAV